MTKAVKSSSLLDVLLVSGSKWSGHFVVAPVLDTLSTYINHRAAWFYDTDFQNSRVCYGLAPTVHGREGIGHQHPAPLSEAHGAVQGLLALWSGRTSPTTWTKSSQRETSIWRIPCAVVKTILVALDPENLLPGIRVLLVCRDFEGGFHRS